MHLQGLANQYLVWKQHQVCQVGIIHVLCVMFIPKSNSVNGIQMH